MRTFFGIVCLVFGLAVSGWLVHTSYEIIVEAVKPKILDLIAPLEPQARSILTPQGNVEFPPSLLAGAGYGVVVVVLWIAAAVASALLRAGAQLLSPDIEILLKKNLSQMK